MSLSQFQEKILCVLTNNVMFPMEVSNGGAFDLNAFCSKYTNSEYALFYISPSLIQILPDSGIIQVPEKLKKNAPDFRLQLLPRNGPHFILKIYPRTDKDIEFAPWNIIFDQNSNFSLDILNTIFQQSFCVDAEKLEFEFDPNDAQIDFSSPVANQRDVLNTTKIYLNVSMQQKAADYAKRRTKIIEEIFSTEANYVNELRLVKEYFNEEFYQKLKIGDDIYRRTFKSIGEIYPVHERFLKALAPVGHAIESSIGQVFLNYYSLFRIASPHICNFASANDEINELIHTNRQFSNGVTKILQDYFGGKTMESLLVTPVQRLPRYPLLLRDLLKATSELHWDYMDIKNSLNNIQKLVQDMDMKKREQDELNFVADLQAKIGNHYQVIKTGRRGLASIENIKTSKGFKGSVYLFNDALLIWKSSPTEFLEESLTTVKLQRKSGFLTISDTYSIPEGKETDSFCAKFLPAKREMIMKLCSYGNALAWTKMEYGTGPSLLACSCIAYYDDTLYLFGGKFPDGRSSNDLWKREEGRWKLIETIHSPSPRYGCTMSAFEGKLIVFGGQNGDRYFNDLLLYEIKTRKWSIIDAPNKPSPRSGHTSVLIEADDLFDDEYDEESSTATSGSNENAASETNNSSNNNNNFDVEIVEDPKAQLWVFGGKTIEQTYSNDLFVFDFSVNQWFRFETDPDESPSPRAYCVSFLINDEKSGGNISFAIQGGRDAENAFNDLWSFDVTNRTGWSQPETKGDLPEARYGHVCGIINNNFYVIGGVDINNESVPPHKLNMNEIPYVWENIPQCDEPEIFIDGAATTDPNYGVIVFSPSTGYTTIRLSYNAENTLNCEEELSKEKKKIKNAELTCANWSRPFYNKTENTVTMKVDSDEETDFVLPFKQKSFENVWTHQNFFAKSDEKSSSEETLSPTHSSGNGDLFFSLNENTKSVDNLINNEQSFRSIPRPNLNYTPVPRHANKKNCNGSNSIKRRGKRPSSLNSESQDCFFLDSHHKNPNELNGIYNKKDDLIDFSLSVDSNRNSQKINSNPNPNANSFPNQNSNLNPNVNSFPNQNSNLNPNVNSFPNQNSNLIPNANSFPNQNSNLNPNANSSSNQNSSQPQTPNNYNKKKYLPVKKFLSNTGKSEVANRNVLTMFKGFGTVKPIKSKARDLFESPTKDAASDNNNPDANSVDNDFYISPNTENLHRSSNSLSGSFLPNSIKPPLNSTAKMPKPTMKNAKLDSSGATSFYDSTPSLGDLIEFTSSEKK